MTGPIKYPRRVFIRQSFRLLGRALLPLLADVRIIGKDNFPQKDPLIVVGNHTAAMEAGIREVHNLALWAVTRSYRSTSRRSGASRTLRPDRKLY